MNNDDWMIAKTVDKIFTGGCHYGAVRFRVTGPIGKILVFHCSDCRRIAGMSRGSSWIDKDRVEWLSDDRLACYASSSYAKRGYCRDCGSSLFCRMHARDFIGIAPGAFDESGNFQLIGQLFAASHPAWGHVTSKRCRILTICGMRKADSSARLAFAGGGAQGNARAAPGK